MLEDNNDFFGQKQKSIKKHVRTNVETTARFLKNTQRGNLRRTAYLLVYELGKSVKTCREYLTTIEAMGWIKVNDIEGTWEWVGTDEQIKNLKNAQVEVEP